MDYAASPIADSRDIRFVRKAITEHRRTGQPPLLGRHAAPRNAYAWPGPPDYNNVQEFDLEENRPGHRTRLNESPLVELSKDTISDSELQ
jgi:hypothetical protein